MVRNSVRGLGKIGGTLAAVAATIVVCMLGIAVMTNLLLNGKMVLSSIDLSMDGLLLIAVFVGSQVLFKIEERRLIYSIIVGAIVVIMTVLSGFMMDGEFQNIIRNLIAVTAGCVLSVLRFLKGHRKKRGRSVGYR